MINPSDVLDVAMGLVFIFLLFSLLATWVRETIAGMLSWRSKQLVKIIQNLLDEGVPAETPWDQFIRPIQNFLPAIPEDAGPLGKQWSKEKLEPTEKLKGNVVKAFYEHPVIKRLAPSDKRPSYIRAREAAAVLLDLFFKAGTKNSARIKIGLDDIENGIQMLENEFTREALLSIVQIAKSTATDKENEIAVVRQGIEDWYNAAMERTSGWYKRKVQWVALIIGLTLAVIFNADTIQITYKL